MPRISMWSPNKTNDYRFFDRTIREQFHIGGVGALVHKYIGPEDAPNLDDPTQPAYDDIINETTIQDLLLLENRDRKYDMNVYDMRGVYNVSDNDFDLTQFGLFLTNDTLYMTFHLNEMVELLGRKLMSGDVIELPHLIDNYGLSDDTPPIPKFYAVGDGNKGGEGFSASWWPHIWRVKLEPITDSQEFDGILGQGADDGSMANIFSTFSAEMDITNAIVDSATQDDPIGGGTALTTHLHNYVDAEGFSWDAGETIDTGGNFPSQPNQGNFFIRTDFQPNRLFVYRDSRWVRLYDNIDDRTWSDRTFNASTFVNNTTEDVASGIFYPSRQDISEVIPPRADYDDTRLIGEGVIGVQEDLENITNILPPTIAIWNANFSA
jgi:hypothetical protein